MLSTRDLSSVNQTFDKDAVHGVHRLIDNKPDDKVYIKTSVLSPSYILTDTLFVARSSEGSEVCESLRRHGLPSSGYIED